MIFEQFGGMNQLQPPENAIFLFVDVKNHEKLIKKTFETAFCFELFE
jgi:hypothetical protein